MESERLDCTLADACSQINYGLTASASSERKGPKFLRITDIVSGQIDWNTVPHVEVDEAIEEKYRLYDGDIVIARTGASTGSSAYVKNPPSAVFASYLVRLQANQKYDARFIAYFLKSNQFQDFLRGVLGDKSAQPNASASTMTSAPLDVPKSKDVQMAIAHILGTFDDKIELNRRTNQTLEAMARALFRSWFVDFDPVRAKQAGRDPGLPEDIADLFPDRLVQSELGEIPEGWSVKDLGDCFDLTMGQSPPGSSYNEDGEGLPFFQGKTDFGFRYPGNRKFCTSPTRFAKPGDTLVSVRAPVGDLNMAWEKCCIGRGVAALRHISGSSSFTYYAMGSIQDSIKEYEQSGTVFGAINKNQFESLKILDPPTKVIRAFHASAHLWDERIRANTEVSANLKAVHDVLLPKLISGQLRTSSTWNLGQ